MFDWYSLEQSVVQYVRRSSTVLMIVQAILARILDIFACLVRRPYLGITFWRRWRSTFKIGQAKTNATESPFADRGTSKYSTTRLESGSGSGYIMMSSNSASPPKRSKVDLLLDDIETAVVDGVDHGIQTCREKSIEVGFCGGIRMPSMYGEEDRNEISGGAANTPMSSTNMESLFSGFNCLSDTEGGDDDETEENVKILMPQGLTHRKKDDNLVVDTVNDNTSVAKSALSPASLTTCGSQSVMGMSLTESFSYDGMPPPMSLETYSSEKEGDEQFLQQHMALSTEQLESPSNVLLPFTPRPGKPIFWRNVSITVAGRDTAEPDRKVLNNVYGEVPALKTTAIIGSPGAG